jgi:hypothetical protein
MLLDLVPATTVQGAQRLDRDRRLRRGAQISV